MYLTCVYTEHLIIHICMQWWALCLHIYFHCINGMSMLLYYTLLNTLPLLLPRTAPGSQCTGATVSWSWLAFPSTPGERESVGVSKFLKVSFVLTVLLRQCREICGQSLWEVLLHISFYTMSFRTNLQHIHNRK